MRSLDNRVEVAGEVLPTSFFIEEVNKFLELFFLNEDEGTACFADDNFCLVIILGILQMLDCLQDQLCDDEWNFFHNAE